MDTVPTASPPQQLPPPQQPARRIDSAELLGRARELAIVHRGELYTLRQTRNGKLILTK
jgi:hemin uptake protein HemP